jgi:ribose transport system permease protein
MTAQGAEAVPIDSTRPSVSSNEGSPEPTAPGQARHTSRSHFDVMGIAQRYALVVLLGLLLLCFSILPATSAVFPTVANLQNIAGNESVVAVAALAALFPLLCGQFDLSIGAVLGMAQIVAASAMSAHGLPLWLAIPLAVTVAAACGAVNGFLVAWLRVNPLIATLGTSTIIVGLVSLYTGDTAIVNGIPTSISDLGAKNLFGLPRPAWILIAVAILVSWLLTQTPYGRHLTAVGSSAAAARLVGLSVQRLVFTSFVLSSALAGVAGVLQLARTGSANPAIGSGYTLPALSAVFLGATTIRPGRFNVPGTLVGVAFVAVSVNGLTLAGTADWVDPVFNGSALVLAVTLSSLVGRRRGATA